mgnify:CR=1 FL=1
MRLREIYYRELVDGTLQEKEYPFTSDDENYWTDLNELAEYLFPHKNIQVEGNWVTLYDFDDEDDKISKREFKFEQYNLAYY